MDFSQLLHSVSIAAVEVRDDTVVASNSFASALFPNADWVFVKVSDFEADIEGVRFRQVAELDNNSELYIKVSDVAHSQHIHLFDNLSFLLSEELSVSQAAIEFIKKHLENGDAESALDCVRRIQKSQFRLIRLATNLREISEHNVDIWQKELVDFRKLCKELTGSICALIDDAKVVFCDRTEPSESAVSAVNPDRIEIMLLNLISNAIKFSDGDDSTIKLILSKNDERIFISVENKINKEFAGSLDSIFNSYLDDITERASNGSGFGLTAAQHIARAHGGNIMYASYDGIITFTAAIPISTFGRTTIDERSHISDNAMRRLLIGLSDVLSWEKYGSPFTE